MAAGGSSLPTASLGWRMLASCGLRRISWSQLGVFGLGGKKALQVEKGSQPHARRGAQAQPARMPDQGGPFHTFSKQTCTMIASKASPWVPPRKVSEL